MSQSVLLSIVSPFLGLVFSLLQIVPGLYILSPTDGQVLTGVVEIKGSVPGDDFRYAEVSYAFEDGSAPNWFPLNRLEKPVYDDVLARWDTTTITDGVYRLRVAVYRSDGSTDEITLQGLRVGNYTHYDEASPTEQAAVVESQTAPVELTPTSTPLPRPTDLPANPAAMDRGDLRLSMISGLTFSVILLLVLGIYAFVRKAARK